MCGLLCVLGTSDAYKAVAVAVAVAAGMLTVSRWYVNCCNCWCWTVFSWSAFFIQEIFCGSRFKYSSCNHHHHPNVILITVSHTNLGKPIYLILCKSLEVTVAFYWLHALPVTDTVNAKRLMKTKNINPIQEKLSTGLILSSSAPEKKRKRHRSHFSIKCP